MCCVLKCVTMYQVSAGVFEGQKKTSDPLALELWVIMSCHMGLGERVAEIQTLSSARAVNTPSIWAISRAPMS